MLDLVKGPCGLLFSGDLATWVGSIGTLFAFLIALTACPSTPYPPHPGRSREAMACYPDGRPLPGPPAAGPRREHFGTLVAVKIERGAQALPLPTVPRASHPTRLLREGSGSLTALGAGQANLRRERPSRHHVRESHRPSEQAVLSFGGCRSQRLDYTTPGWRRCWPARPWSPAP